MSFLIAELVDEPGIRNLEIPDSVTFIGGIGRGPAPSELYRVEFALFPMQEIRALSVNRPGILHADGVRLR
jgi:hypothetical protein